MIYISTKKHARFLLLFFAFILVLSVGYFLLQAAPFNYAVSMVSQSIGLKPIYSVETEEKTIAISFDATWGAEHTEDILDILDKYEINTTFFLVNIWIEDNPAIAKEIADRGHEIGLHSVSHPKFTTLTTEEMKTELNDNAAKILEVTGQKATLFRPPYGDYNDTVIQVCQQLDYIPIQWSVDSMDWKGLSSGEIIQRVLNQIDNGKIVLFHNNGENTAAALETILPKLKEEGYTIVPIGELILKDDYYVDYNGRQRRNQTET